ncbi:MAG: hypothetical protein JWO77_3403 [Ilumatobacteraceae bacterium]|nr:hypothetical protein [Ilumatobacteraceae bacterium]
MRFGGGLLGRASWTVHQMSEVGCVSSASECRRNGERKDPWTKIPKLRR